MTSWARPISRRLGTANAELPKKMTRKRRAGCSDADVAKSFFFFLRFFRLYGQRIPDVGRFVEDQHTVEVVDLVLEAARQPSLGAQRELLAVAIEPAHGARRRPHDVAEFARNRQTAFDGFFFTLKIAEHRIDDRVRRLVLAAEMDDDDALADPD